MKETVGSHWNPGFPKVKKYLFLQPRILDLLDDNEEELEEVKNRFKPSHTFVQNTEARKMRFFLCEEDPATLFIYPPGN